MQIEIEYGFIHMSQSQVERLENRVAERDEMNAELRAALNSLQTQATPTPPSQTADINTSSRPHPQTSSESPNTTVTTIDESRQTSAPPTTNSATPGALAEVRPSETGKRYSSGNRVRSPVKRGLKTSSGELLDSSLDNEMRAVGIEFNDSFDSSEGVGFSDSNLDTSILSDHSLPAAAAAVASSTPGRGGDEGNEGHHGNSEQTHKVAWEEVGTSSDQAQATSTPQNSVAPLPTGNHDGTEAEGQGALNNLVKGYQGAGSQEEVEEEVGAESGPLSGGLDGEAMSHDRGQERIMVWYSMH